MTYKIVEEVQPELRSQACVLFSVYKNDTPVDLIAAFASLQHQTVQDFETLIVIDGPVGDDIMETVKGLLKSERTIGRRHCAIIQITANVGLGNAVNIAVPLTKAQYLIAFHGDDVSRANRLARQIAILASDERIGMVSSAIEEFERVPGDMGAVRQVAPDEIKAAGQLWMVNPFNAPSVAMRKAAFDDVKGYTEVKWHEDYVLWAKLLGRGWKIRGITDVLVDMKVNRATLLRRGGFTYCKYATHARWLAYRYGGIGLGGAIAGIALTWLTRNLPKNIRQRLVLRFFRDALLTERS